MERQVELLVTSVGAGERNTFGVKSHSAEKPKRPSKIAKRFRRATFFQKEGIYIPFDQLNFCETKGLFRRYLRKLSLVPQEQKMKDVTVKIWKTVFLGRKSQKNLKLSEKNLQKLFLTFFKKMPTTSRIEPKKSRGGPVWAYGTFVRLFSLEKSSASNITSTFRNSVLF